MSAALSDVLECLFWFKLMKAIAAAPIWQRPLIHGVRDDLHKSGCFMFVFCDRWLIFDRCLLGKVLGDIGPSYSTLILIFCCASPLHLRLYHKRYQADVGLISRIIIFIQFSTSTTRPFFFFSFIVVVSSDRFVSGCQQLSSLHRRVITAILLMCIIYPTTLQFKVFYSYSVRFEYKNFSFC